MVALKAGDDVIGQAFGFVFGEGRKVGQRANTFTGPAR